MNRYQSIELAGWKLIVYLPPSYHESDVRFPVAYVQDGGEQFDHNINQIEMLFREGQIPELVLVGIEPHNRNDEYTPWPAAPLLTSKPPFGGRGRIYVDCVADVIKPHIDAAYRTKTDRANTAILGGSFGGLVSMFASYWRPDTFGKIGMLSASFWYEGVLDFLREQSAPAKEQWLYMSVGSCEGIYKRNAQRQMVRNTLEARDLWLQKGFPAEQLCFELVDGGTHDAVFMAERLPNALKWLFEGKKLLAKGEEQPDRPFIPGTHYFDLRSTHSGRDYRLFVYVPTTEAPSAGYPIIYSLDGNASFHSIAEAMRLQSRHPLGIEPAVIVGIGYDSDEPIVSDRRFYDYTELADPAVMRKRPDGSPWPETGGADEFLTFIEEELKPEIERRYTIDRSRQALFGHSLGGWFALHVLFTRPEAFHSYIAGSPSVWWNDKSLLARMPELGERMQRGEIDAELMIAVGSEEKQLMVENAEQVYTLLKSYAGHEMRLAFELFEGEGHVSVVHTLISRFLRFMLQRKQS